MTGFMVYFTPSGHKKHIYCTVFATLVLFKDVAGAPKRIHCSIYIYFSIISLCKRLRSSNSPREM